MKELAKAYIEERVLRARSVLSDELAALHVHGGVVPAEAASDYAKEGDPGLTASHIHLDNTLPISQIAEMLAEAYAKSAEESTMNAADPDISTSFLIKSSYLRGARNSNRIAAGLRRAAEKVKNC